MNSLKSLWQSATWPMRAIAILLTVILTVGLALAIRDAYRANQYAKKLAQTESRAQAAEAKAATAIMEADRLHTQANQLHDQLAEANQRLLDLNAQLIEAEQKTVITRKIYVASQNAPTPSLPLTGDTTVDRERLCATLAQLGHPCR